MSHQYSNYLHMFRSKTLSYRNSPVEWKKTIMCSNRTKIWQFIDNELSTSQCVDYSLHKKNDILMKFASLIELVVVRMTMRIWLAKTFQSHFVIYCQIVTENYKEKCDMIHEISMYILGCMTTATYNRKMWTIPRYITTDYSVFQPYMIFIYAGCIVNCWNKVRPI